MMRKSQRLSGPKESMLLSQIDKNKQPVPPTDSH